MNRWAFILVAVGLLVSCNKIEEVRVLDNVPPPDHTIDSSTMQLYVYKAYVNLAGREPIGNEKAEALVVLRQDNFSWENRKQFMDMLLAKDEFYQNSYNVARAEYLQNTDSIEIDGQIKLFESLLAQPSYAPFFDLLRGEVNRLDTLQNTRQNLLNGQVDFKEMQRRCANNYFYDQINMGTENFVISTFQNFLFRYPTAVELTQSKLMADGQSAALFFNLGKNKNDYLRIFFNSDDYFEGQVRYVFRKYLFREPSPAEIYFFADIYKSTNNYKSLLKDVLSRDEYAGLE
ncbi:MAG: hypothetical protein IPP77_12055 [Bacteroidetes bacterium]|nr:hypothetical protein [Bacteroidota bacterium]